MKARLLSYLPWSAETSLLVIILVVAGVLRTVNLFDFSLSHDETGAIGRLAYSSVSEVIEYAVRRVDTHPPGVQVFMWYWSRWFGTSDWVMRLPFLLIGWYTVYQLYAIGKNLFGSGTGLVLAGLWATLEYSVYYSQLARPYIPGLFAVLGLVLAMTKFSKQHNPATVVALVFYGSLATYIHHFALLQVGLLGLAGFALLPKRWKPWFWICTSWFVLYIPNLNLFFYQLAQGGVGSWLGEPTLKQLLQFFPYLFNYSWVLVGVLVIPMLLGIKNVPVGNRWFWMLLVLGLAPLAIAYGYSVWRNPVFQYSVLIFSIPFFLLACTSWLNGKGQIWLAIAVLGTGVLTLTLGRNYYPFMNNMGYKEYVQAACGLTAEPDQPTAYWVTDGEFQVTTYQNQLNCQFPFRYNYPPTQASTSEFRKQVMELDAKRVFLSDFPPERTAVVVERFPKLQKIMNGSGYQHLLLSATRGEENWFRKREGQRNEPLTPSQAYSQKLEGTVDQLAMGRHSRCAAYAQVEQDPADLIIALFRGDELLDFRSREVAPGSTEYLPLYPAQLLPVGANLRNYRLEVYLYYKGDNQCITKQLGFISFPENPLEWGLFEPL